VVGTSAPIACYCWSGGKQLDTPKIGISPAQRSDVIEILKGHLADLHVLYIKTRNYHWNVVGPRFQPLHAFFEEQYDILAAAIDEVAERIRMLQGKSPGSMAEFLKIARLCEEKPGVYPPADGMIRNLLADHEAIIRQLRKDIDTTAEKDEDIGSSDFLTGLIESHEKMAWMLRSFLDE
jgi:starvation-inducible DNA-binding protein